MFVAVDGKAAGLIGVADPIKASTPEAIEKLHRAGLRVVMLTGDSAATAQAVARKSVSTKYTPMSHRKTRIASFASCRPRVRSSPWPGTASTTLRRLAQADVGVAMGTGTDVAMESAGVTLVRGDSAGSRQGART